MPLKAFLAFVEVTLERQFFPAQENFPGTYGHICLEGYFIKTKSNLLAITV
jgi:hypothetical protein